MADNVAMAKILVVEDNASMREMLTSIIAEKGFETENTACVGDALALLKKNDFALIVSDLQLPDMDGLSFYKKIKHLQIPFIILTAFGSIEKAVEAIKEGAFDFIAKPVDPDYLLLMINKAMAATQILRENLVLREVLQTEMGKTVIIGSSREILKEAEKIRQVAQTSTTVLLRGESGTGKELFARALHALSPRKDRPFITINSASIPDNLLENELFGHEKGSYTGAYLRQLGKLELAQGGTFFFDEIGDFPYPAAGENICAFWKKNRSRASAAARISASTSVSSSPPTRTWKKPLLKSVSARTFISASPAFPFNSRRCAKERRTSVLLGDYFARKISLEIKKCEITPFTAGPGKAPGLQLAGQCPRTAKHD